MSLGSLVISQWPMKEHQRPLSGLSLKRVFDVVAAVLALIAFVPLFLLIAFVVSSDGGPVFFAHTRIGRHGRPFRCLKFRTMFLGAEECLKEYLSLHPQAGREWQQDQKLGFDPRITAVGSFLRRSSLDELPQLLNVIRGDMSLVGPRPVTLSELQQRYGVHAKAYLSMRPGITGLWQVSGRNCLSYRDRVLLDANYAEHQSLIGDVGILFQTVSVMFNGDRK